MIRASLILKSLKEQLGDSFFFIWSGQHYSDNMKDVFFRQLEVQQPDLTLELDTESDQAMIGSLIGKLGKALAEIRPDAVVFLGDTNTVVGSLAAASLNIPVVHIEGCMRSYDWRMPEEKFRTTIDALSDVIYAYIDEYKNQGILEGINPDRIIVTGNPIVDVLDYYFKSGRVRLSSTDRQTLLDSLGVEEQNFWVMTCHRRENIESVGSLTNILALAGASTSPVVFAAGYRTQRMLKELNLELPSNVKMIDPIGYVELMELLDASIGSLTDSGTVVEEAAVLGVPSVQMRTSTERPQVYDNGSSIKFDPLSSYAPEELSRILEVAASRRGKIAHHNLGDGKASERIVSDLLARLESEDWAGHLPDASRRPIERNFGFGLSGLGKA